MVFFISLLYPTFFFILLFFHVPSQQTIVVYVRGKKMWKIIFAKNEERKKERKKGKKIEIRSSSNVEEEEKKFQLKMGRLESNITASLTEKNERQCYIDGYIFYFYAFFSFLLLCCLQFFFSPTPIHSTNATQSLIPLTPSYYRCKEKNAMLLLLPCYCYIVERKRVRSKIKLYYSIIHRFNLSLYGH